MKSEYKKYAVIKFPYDDVTLVVEILDKCPIPPCRVINRKVNSKHSFYYVDIGKTTSVYLGYIVLFSSDNYQETFGRFLLETL